MTQTSPWNVTARSHYILKNLRVPDTNLTAFTSRFINIWVYLRVFSLSCCLQSCFSIFCLMPTTSRWTESLTFLHLCLKILLFSDGKITNSSMCSCHALSADWFMVEEHLGAVRRSSDWCILFLQDFFDDKENQSWDSSVTIKASVRKGAEVFGSYSWSTDNIRCLVEYVDSPHENFLASGLTYAQVDNALA